MPPDPATDIVEDVPELNALAFLDPFPAIAAATAEVHVDTVCYFFLSE